MTPTALESFRLSCRESFARVPSAALLEGLRRAERVSKELERAGSKKEPKA